MIFHQKKHRFFIIIRLLFAEFLEKMSFTAILFVATTTRQTPCTKAFQEMGGSMVVNLRKIIF